MGIAIAQWIGSSSWGSRVHHQSGIVHDPLLMCGVLVVAVAFLWPVVLLGFLFDAVRFVRPVAGYGQVLN